MVAVKKIRNNGNKLISSLPGDYYYIPVVDGKEYSYVAETEDMALLLGIGIKYDGRNSQFAKFAARMLNINTIWK